MLTVSLIATFAVLVAFRALICWFEPTGPNQFSLVLCLAALCISFVGALETVPHV